MGWKGSAICSAAVPAFIGDRCWSGASGAGAWRRRARRRPDAAWRSLLGLGLQLADYWLGYVLLLIPGLVRSSLIIFDRYYYDMVADPARYRYGGSRRLLEVLSRVAPHPDLILLLDAPADVIVDRKGELTLQEAEHLRGSYLSVCARVKNVHRLDATQPGAVR